MDELEKINNKLESLESLYGYTGVVIGLFVLVSGFLLWRFLTTYSENYARSFFNQSLAKVQANLVQEIGEKLIIQRGEIQKDVAELRSNLSLLTGQKSNYLNEMRNCMTRLYECQTDWANTILDKSAYQLSEHDMGIRRRFLGDIDEARHRYHVATASFNIYIEDNELNQIMADLLIATNKMQGIKATQLLEVEHQYQNYIELNNRSHHNWTVTNSVDAKAADLQKIRDKIVSASQNREKEILDLYEPIVQLQKLAAKRTSFLLRQSFDDE